MDIENKSIAKKEQDLKCIECLKSDNVTKYGLKKGQYIVLCINCWLDKRRTDNSFFICKICKKNKNFFREDGKKPIICNDCNFEEDNNTPMTIKEFIDNNS
jgi:hypothetical protein